MIKYIHGVRYVAEKACENEKETFRFRVNGCHRGRGKPARDSFLGRGATCLETVAPFWASQYRSHLFYVIDNGAGMLKKNTQKWRFFVFLELELNVGLNFRCMMKWDDLGFKIALKCVFF